MPAIRKEEKEACKWGKGTENQGETHSLARCSRPPATIRAAALITSSARPCVLERTAESDFYSVEPK